MLNQIDPTRRRRKKRENLDLAIHPFTTSSSSSSSMVREKDICWEYAERLEGNKVRCRFCLRVFHGGISRLKNHLSGIPNKGVIPCIKARDEVVDRVRSILRAKDPGKDESIKAVRGADDAKSCGSISAVNPFSSPEATPISRAFPIQAAEYEENAERSIALFFFDNKLDLSIARSPSYHLMLEAVGRCGGGGFRGPSPESLKTTWLEKIKSEVTLHSAGAVKEWVVTGCTLIVDTWTDDKSRSSINFLVSSPSCTYLYKTADTSLYHKNTKCVTDLIESVIQEVGPENVVQVILDSSLMAYPGMTGQIVRSYSGIFVSPCVSQCVSVMLEDFCKVEWVGRCVVRAQAVSKFVYNNTEVLEAVRRVTGGEEVIRTGVTKAVSTFLSLHSLLKNKQKLRHVLSGPEHGASPAVRRREGLRCIEVVQDSGFWRAVDESVAISEPLLRLLREVSGGKPGLACVYEMMTKAKESIRTYYIMDDNKCNTFLEIVDRRWQGLMHSPLHSAAAFLNPGIQYNPEVKYLSSVKEDLYNVLEKLLPLREMRGDITNQIFLFTRAGGMFGCNLAREARHTVSPWVWWEQYGDSAPVLQRIAVRVLSQVCSKWVLRKQWEEGQQQQMEGEKRNRIDKDTLSDMDFVHYNLRLKNRVESSDPIQMDDVDMMSEWVEEADWLDRFGDGPDLTPTTITMTTRQFAPMFPSTDDIFGL